MAFINLPIEQTITQTNRDQVQSVSVIIPALDEEENISNTLTEIKNILLASVWSESFEIIVADNGSKDRTRQFAKLHGASVVEVPVLGYGSACWGACLQARGDILVFVDGDGSPNPKDLLPLLNRIRFGADLVIGVRSQPEPGSMSAAQKFGNGLACVLLRLLWNIPAADIGPFRAIKRTAFDRLNMEDRGFGWTVEMQVKAAALGLSVAEVPVHWRVRANGFSKIGGTLIGIWRAGRGILGKIFVLRRNLRFRLKHKASSEKKPAVELVRDRSSYL